MISSSNSNNFPQQNLFFNQPQEDQEEDFDALLDGSFVSQEPPKMLHYISEPLPQDDRIYKLNIEFLHSENFDQTTLLPSDRKRFVILENNEFRFDPSILANLKNVTQINVKDSAGDVKVFKNDGAEQGFVIKAQSQEEMKAIAKAVNQISLKILKDKKKASENSNELKPEHHEISATSGFEPKINLKHAKIQEIAPDEDKITDKTCHTFMATLKSQEDTGQTIHSKKQRQSKELEQETELHQKIVAKEVTQFELHRELNKGDYLKTTQRVEKLHEEEVLIPEIVIANH